jgi:hypothetical protein
MALDAVGERVMVVYREPAALAVLDARDGKTIVRVETCGDADDVFFDAKRQRAYISCGEGVIDVVQRQGDTYASMSRIRTVPGARTALFVPELDRLFLAVRAGGGDGAAICRDGSKSDSAIAVAPCRHNWAAGMPSAEKGRPKPP